jgi:predicted Zn-dependent protease
VGGSFESDEKVLYDGPAPGPVASPEPAAAPEPTADPSASNQQTNFRLASQTSRNGSGEGSGAFGRGLRSYRDGNMNEALVGFEAAAVAEPQNALYQYYRALAVYNQQGAEAASQWLQQAVELERQAPVANYGKRMERVQGRARLWIEQARAEAGLGGK